MSASKDKQPIRSIVVKGVRAKIGRPEDFGTFYPATKIVGHIGRGDKLPALEIIQTDGINFLIRDPMTNHECRVDLSGLLDPMNENNLMSAMRSYLQREVEWRKRLEKIGTDAKSAIDGSSKLH